MDGRVWCGAHFGSSVSYVVNHSSVAPLRPLPTEPKRAGVRALLLCFRLVAETRGQRIVVAGAAVYLCLPRPPVRAQGESRLSAALGSLIFNGFVKR